MSGWARMRAIDRREALWVLALFGCFATSAYAVSFLIHLPRLARLVAWFVGGIVAHDLILFPLYSLGNRSLVSVVDRVPRPAGVPMLNFVRLPAMGSGLLLLVFLPTITRHGQDLYGAQSGLSQSPYLARWLAVTAALFLLSAALYVLRVVQVRRRQRRAGP